MILKNCLNKDSQIWLFNLLVTTAASALSAVVQAASNSRLIFNLFAAL